MDNHGLVNLSSAAQQATQCKVGFKGVIINFQAVDKGGNSPVRLFIKQVVQPLVVVGIMLRANALTAP